MITYLTKSICILLCIACVAAWPPAVAAAQSTEQQDALARLNEARRTNGAPMLAWSVLLGKAAQRHSDDMASKGFVDEIGSDGSTPRKRVEAAGYPRWAGAQIWSEAIYAGQTSFDEALNFFLSDDNQRRALLSDRVREVGIGVAKDGLRTYWTITLGAQPAVLPIFINDGAPAANDRNVAVQLTQENAVPNGEGNIIGRVVEVRLGGTPNLAGAAWQPWEALLPFTLERGAGEKTIYVEMRDGAGRTTLAADTIIYDPNSKPGTLPVAPGVPAPSPTLDPLPTPTALVLGMNPVVTLPPDPSATPAPVPVSPATQTAPAATPVAVVMRIAPTNTATPPAPRATAVVVVPAVGSSFVETPVPSTPAVRQFSAGAQLTDWLLPLYAVAQIGVIAIALILFIRRK